MKGAYLTLSYVWGEEQPHRTGTMANISAYADGIDIAALPQTIREAIYVTRALGFQLLRVDSPCIIQDSTADKHREIGRMRGIYRNAYLTIIAASASRVTEGFLQDRRTPSIYSECTLPFISPAGSTPAERRAGQPQVGTIRFLPDRYFHHAPHYPIHHRGWCLQELLMSPRMLVFTGHTLEFRCQTATMNVDGSPRCVGVGDHKRLPNLLLEPVSIWGRLPPKSKAWWSVWLTWQHLVACAGIAEEFQRALRSDYLAGLWCATLLEDLLWARVAGVAQSARMPSRQQRRRPTAYRAPSWSWASTEALYGSWLLDPPEYPIGQVAEIVECETRLVDPALPFGEVLGGYLILRVPLSASCSDFVSEAKGSCWFRLQSSGTEVQDGG
ncbi:heterokaryon incompatibility protein-domain-containing protein [Trametes polyzona]|nr:heterokaryon incompatibility protein-domain-containing protein [Trametes polyzona]